jgi:hypothetical protein
MSLGGHPLPSDIPRPHAAPHAERYRVALALFDRWRGLEPRIRRSLDRRDLDFLDLVPAVWCRWWLEVVLADGGRAGSLDDLAALIRVGRAARYCIERGQRVGGYDLDGPKAAMAALFARLPAELGEGEDGVRQFRPIFGQPAEGDEPYSGPTLSHQDQSLWDADEFQERVYAAFADAIWAAMAEIGPLPPPPRPDDWGRNWFANALDAAAVWVKAAAGRDGPARGTVERNDGTPPGWVREHFRQQQYKLLTKLWGGREVSAVELAEHLGYKNPETAHDNLRRRVVATNAGLTEKASEIGESLEIGQRTRDRVLSYFLRPVGN